MKKKQDNISKGHRGILFINICQSPVATGEHKQGCAVIILLDKLAVSLSAELDFVIIPVTYLAGVELFPVCVSFQKLLQQ